MPWSSSAAITVIHDEFATFSKESNGSLSWKKSPATNLIGGATQGFTSICQNWPEGEEAQFVVVPAGGGDPVDTRAAFATKVGDYTVITAIFEVPSGASGQFNIGFTATGGDGVSYTGGSVGYEG